MLGAYGLEKQFGRRMVVKGVTLTIDENEVVGLLGNNGAGKSTTFKMIIGTLTPTGGRVEFLGKDITRSAMHTRCRMGISYLAQVTTIFRDLTVEDNLYAILEQLSLSRRERKQRCDKLLSDYGLSHVRRNYASACSGGEKRKIEIARALVTQPKLILLDEPFAGVDPKSTDSIREMIYEIKDRGISVLITDHDAQQTLASTDRTYIMSDGEVIAEGLPEEVVDNPHCRKAYFGKSFEYKPIERPTRHPVAVEGDAA